jgi:hypothetical protein
MSTSRRSGDGGKAPKLEASSESVTKTEDGVELVVKLRNPLDRAVHYIADVRAMIFDPATRRLRVQLSDRGRQLLPGGIAMEPQFRMIDPHSEALTTVRLPRTIVKLAEKASPTGELLFEEHSIEDAVAIELEIGWADTPYYSDPREKSRGVQPVTAWEQDTTRVTLPGPGSEPQQSSVS